MLRSNNNEFYDEILSLSLYGEASAPVRVASEDYLSPGQRLLHDVFVDVNDYMLGPGRFANPAFFEIVQKFFNFNDLALFDLIKNSPNSYLDGSDLVIAKSDLQSLLGIVRGGLSINQAYFDDGQDDYASRVFFWSSTSFQISDDALFVFRADGEREVRNFSVEPRRDDTGSYRPDNYDFAGGSLAEQLEPVVRPLVDPFELTDNVDENEPNGNRPGHEVTINFRNQVPTYTLSEALFEDAIADAPQTIAGTDVTSGTVESQLFDFLSLDRVAAAQALAATGPEFIRDLYQRGAINYQQDGYSVFLGSERQDSFNLSAFDISGLFLIYPHLLLTEGLTEGAWVLGGGGNDNISGFRFLSNVLDGGNDDDTLTGGFEDDTLIGGFGADKLYGGFGDDALVADAEDTVIDGGIGFDTVDYSEATSAVNWVSVSAQISGIEVVIGSDFGDTFELPSNLLFPDVNIEVQGGEGEDTIIGNSADNRLRGGDDIDTISGGQGVDTISGDGGNDTIDGGDENWLLGEGDVLDGGSGNDTIYGEEGNDIIFGESGNDTLIGGIGRDDIFGGSGRDIIDGAQDDETALGVSFADNLWSGAGADIIRANDGDIFHDPDGGDRVLLDGVLLFGGEETEPGSGVYKAQNGTTYTLSGSTLSVSTPGNFFGFGASDITINNFRNGLAGIRLVDADDPDKPPRPGIPYPFDAPPISPIIFDLNGDGVQTIGLEVSSTFFDLDGDGRAERTSFASPEDGLLVLDLNGNGTIDNINELFGSETRDGFFELDQFLTAVERFGGVLSATGNLLTEADLRVWRDANSDGISQADEIFTFEELGIAEIPRVGSTVPLDSTIPIDERPEFFGFDSNGNRISSIGEGFFADGTSFAVADIFFNNDPTSVRPSDTPLDPIAAILPDLPGGARFDDLRAAATDDEELRDLVLDVVRNAGSFSGSELRAAVENILLVWTGLADQDLPSRGQWIDPEPLAVLELIYGQTYRQRSGTNAGTANPGPSAAHELLQTYNVILDSFVTQFASQTYEAQLQLAFIDEMDALEARTSPFAALSELYYDRRIGVANALDFDALVQSVVDEIPDGTNGEKLAYLDLIGSTLTGLRQDQFGAGNEFILLGRDNVFEEALRDAFAVLDDIALREVAIARALGAERLLGTDAEEILDTNDPSLFRDLDGVSSIIEGGLGRDTLTGGNGGDLYVFSPGDGHDRVEDNGSENRRIQDTLTLSEGGRAGNPGGVDRLVFLDRSISDVRFSRIGLSVLITFESSPDDSVLIPTVLRGRDIGNVIEQLVFQDGLITDVVDRISNGELDAQIVDVPDGIFSDTELAELEAEGGVDFSSNVPATSGDDVIVGASGSDRYLLAEGVGNDTITAGYRDTTVDTLLVEFNQDEVIIATDRNGGAGLLVTTIGKSVDQDGNPITVRGEDSVFFTDFALPSSNQLFRYNLRSIRFLDRLGGAFQIVQDVERSDFVFLPYDLADIELVRGIDAGGSVANTSSSSSNLFVTAAGSIVEDLGRQFSSFSDPGRGFVFESGRILSAEDVALLVPLTNLSPDQTSTLNGSIYAESIVGGTQTDRINAAAGDDTIDAGAGDDEVVGGTGDDVITGGLGNDRLVGDSASDAGSFGSSGPATVGSDAYVYNSGDGNDRIADFGTGQVDRDVLILNDLTLDDIVLSRVIENDLRPDSGGELEEIESGLEGSSSNAAIDNLIITNTITGQTITVEGQFSNSVFGLELIEFSDGSTISREEILDLVVLTNDTSDGADGTTLSGKGRIYGGSQFSTIVGTSTVTDNPNPGPSSPLGLISTDQLPEFDTVVFDSGSTSQTIVGIEVVEFRDAISADVSISRDTSGTLFLTLNTTNEQIRVDNFFFDTATTDLNEEIDAANVGATTSLRFIRFIDGELFTVEDIAQRAVVSGTDGDDVIEADGLGGRLAGGLGADVIVGGVNADQIDGGEGADELLGGAGDDAFFARDADGSDVIDGQSGFDTYDATFSTLALNVDLEDLLPDNGDGGADNGDVVILDPPEGDLGEGGGLVVVEDGEGGGLFPIDPVPVDPSEGDTRESSGTAISSDGSVDQLTSIERVIGGRGNDIISGSSVDETFAGNDGDDQLSGGGGDDRLAGGRGADTLDGGEGYDTADFSNARSGVALSLATGIGSAGEADGDTFVNVEAVEGSNFSDNIEGDGQDNVLTLGRGDDGASGGGGNDLIIAGAGDDLISGDAGDDELIGGQGNDVLQGGEGNDELIGGLGNDRLLGGVGSDVYIINHENSLDVIEDLGTGAGDTDLLTLVDLRADQVELIRDRDNLIVEFDVFGSVTILEQFAGDGSGVENIEFSDGSTIDRNAILAASGARLIGPIFAFDDSFSAISGGEFSIGSDELLFNDINIDGGALVLVDVMEATNGIVSIDDDGNVLFTSDADFLGIATFNYSVTDGFGAFETASVAIEIVQGAANTAPMLVQPLQAVASDEDAAFSYAIPADTFADPNGDTLTLSATLDDGSELPAWLTFDGTTLTGTPPTDFNGVLGISISASDGEESVSDSFDLTITAVNDAPVVVAPISDVSTLEDAPFAFAIDQASFADVDGDTLTLSATQADGSELPSWIAFDGTSFTGTPPQDFTGTVELSVTASDGEQTATGSFVLTIDPLNDPPVLLQPLADISSLEDQSISFAIPEGTFADVDGDALTLSAALLSGTALPDWLSFDGMTFTGIPPQDFNGFLDVTVTASDAEDTVSDSFRITIDAVNDAPVLIQPLTDVASPEDAAILITIPADAFVDVDGDALTLTATQANGSDLPVWLSLEGDVLTGTPPQDFNGELALEVTASDGVESVSSAFTLTIDPVNDAPVLTQPLADLELLSSDNASIDVSDGVFSDVDGDALTYSVALPDGAALPAWLQFDGTVLTASGLPNEDTALSVVVTASDRTLSVSDEFAITIEGEDTDTGDSEGFTFSSLNSWYDPAYGGGYNVTFEYEVQPEAIAEGELRAWDILATYDGPGTITNGWVSGFPGPASFEITAEGATFSTDGQDYQPDLAEGQTFRITVQVDGAPYTPGEFAFAIFDRDPEFNLADDQDSVLIVAPTNDWGGGLTQNVSFTNTSEVDIDDWQMVLSVPDGVDLTITNVSGASVTELANGDLLFEALSWNEEVAAGGQANFGFTANYTGVSSLTFGSEDFSFTDSDARQFDVVLASIADANGGANWSYGTAQDDALTGSSAASNRIFGALGDDELTGGALGDWLAGGSGDDILNGLEGDDVFWGGHGNDMLFGGLGSDTVQLLGERDSYSIVTQGGALGVQINDLSAIAHGDDGMDHLSSIEQLAFRGGETLNITSPIILDLGGDGITTVSAAESDALFDLDGDGLADDTSWISANDAFLYLDRDGNGTVSGVAEISFIDDVTNAATDLDGLTAFDSNGDGVLNADDERFAEFGVWQDADGDGAVDEGEIASLAQVGIASIDLTGAAVNGTVEFGEVAIANTGSFTLVNGVRREFADAALTYFSAATNMTELSVTNYDFDRKTSKYRIHIGDGIVSVDRKRRRSDSAAGAGQLGANTLLTFGNKTYGRFAPVVLDLDGDGVELVKRSKSNAAFDYDGNGGADNTGWISGDDGFLVIDRNNDGLITEASELSLAAENDDARTGLQGLAAMDSNRDGVIDADDARFGELRVWQDRNANGRTDAGELMTLEEAGIVSVSLAVTGLQDRVKVTKNAVTATSSFTRSNGTTSTVADVSLAYQPGAGVRAAATTDLSAQTTFASIQSQFYADLFGAQAQLPTNDEIFDLLRSGGDDALSRLFGAPERSQAPVGIVSVAANQTAPTGLQFTSEVSGGQSLQVAPYERAALLELNQAEYNPELEEARANFARRLMMINQDMAVFGAPSAMDGVRLDQRSMYIPDLFVA